MRIALFDFTGWDYCVQTAYDRPLGGSQSALCYLAEALAARGHEVWLLNHTQQPGISRGVHCRAIEGTPFNLLKSFEVAIVLNTPKQGVQLRTALSDDALLIAWMQHAHDQPASAPLARDDVREVFDAYAFVSRWQRDRFIERFELSPADCMVLRNAVGPRFARLIDPDVPLPPSKLRPPTLVYTSTPFRGLDVLLDSYPAIRAAVPEVRLDVYSSLQVYQADSRADEQQYGHLYEQCRATEGVAYIGSVPQPQLAERLRTATMLAYPNHFAETSCIAVMEALAAGCQVVTSRLGALPETCSGLAELIDVEDDRERFARRFATATIERLRRIERDPVAADAKLRHQAAQMQQTCTWPVRAAQGESWLEVRQRAMLNERRATR